MKSYERLRNVVASTSAPDAKKSSGKRGASPGFKDDVDMSTLRAVSLEQKIDTLLPLASLKELKREGDHRGRGAKQIQTKLTKEAVQSTMKGAKSFLEQVCKETAAAPLASIREVELENLQQQHGEYRRSLMRKESDVTEVVWRPRELLACEIDPNDPGAAERAKHGEKRSRTETDSPKFTGEDSLIWVELFHPSKPGTTVMDILVRGSTPLYCFKDIIYCLRDIQAEREGHPPSKNGFLFIEGVFYNDMRSEGAVDYSEPIIDFQRRDSLLAPGAPPEMNIAAKGFTAKDMEGVRFCDIGFTVGRPYVMTHQGKCEHKWRIRDVRIPHLNDDKENASYPVVLREGRLYRRGCSVCTVFDGVRVLYGDRMSGESPSFFCQICYDVAHCDAQGNKLFNDFEEYLYDHE